MPPPVGGRQMASALEAVKLGNSPRYECCGPLMPRNGIKAGGRRGSGECSVGSALAQRPGGGGRPGPPGFRSKHNGAIRVVAASVCETPARGWRPRAHALGASSKMKPCESAATRGRLRES